MQRSNLLRNPSLRRCRHGHLGVAQAVDEHYYIAGKGLAAEQVFAQVAHGLGIEVKDVPVPEPGEVP